MTKAQNLDHFQHWRVALACCLFLLGFSACTPQTSLKKTNQKRSPPNRYRPLSFGYSNISDDTVWIDSADLLSKSVGSGRVWSGANNGNNWSFSRKDCTPEALLATNTKFTWWKMADARDTIAARKRPESEDDIFHDELPFPEFDVDADAWRCFYTLQQGDRWVGEFLGVVVKPIGIKTSESTGEQQWLHFYFRNRTENGIGFDKTQTRLVNGTERREVELPIVPPTGEFIGYAATCETGSIYRPEVGSTLELMWHPAGTKQIVVLPDFSPDVKNWYCYFTLNEANGEWTVLFEGVKDD